MRIILPIYASLFLLQACGATSNHGHEVSAATADSRPVSSLERSKQIEGDWGYSTQCNQGHFITISLELRGQKLIGDWSDGTLLSGSDGQIEIETASGSLAAKRCGSDESSGLPLCPLLEDIGDRFQLRHDRLYWYQAPDPKPYAVLTRTHAAKSPTAEDCEATP